MVNKLLKDVHGFAVLIFGAAILFLLYKTNIWVQNGVSNLQADLSHMEKYDPLLSDTISEFRSLVDLKSRDLHGLRNGLSGIAKSKKFLYEAGLSLQEEKRLLEKQFEIMTTFLKIDEENKKISLMRGEQALQDFNIIYSSVTAFGGMTKPMPSLTQIVSKERFANPERGTVEESSGTLKWNPPQVGTSVRSNALGEYVMFTAGPLIIHGPPMKKAEHESFPHLCLGLNLNMARKLYSESVIGTRIIYKSPSVSEPQKKIRTKK